MLVKLKSGEVKDLHYTVAKKAIDSGIAYAYTAPTYRAKIEDVSTPQTKKSRKA